MIIIDWISKLSLENTNTEDDDDWIIDNINEQSLENSKSKIKEVVQTLKSTRKPTMKEIRLEEGYYLGKLETNSAIRTNT